MKKLIIVIFVALSGLFVSSCQDDFLKENVYSSLNSDDFFSTENDLEAAVIGVYAAFQNNNFFGQSIIFIGDMPTELIRGYWNHPLDIYAASSALSSDANQTQISDLWQDTWNVNNRCNLVLNRGSEVEMDQTRKEALMAEVRFIRALTRFYQIQIYGTNIPLIENETTDLNELDVEISDGPAIYSAIIEDLEFAIEHLDLSRNDGRANVGAATGLMAKVYLKMAGYSENPDTGIMEKGDASNYGEARTYLNQLIEMGQYDLLDEPHKVWGDSTNYGEVNEEVIFAIKYTSGGLDEGHGWTSRFVGKNNKTIVPYAWKTLSTTWDFYGTYATDDKRIHTLMINPSKPNGSKDDLPKIWKYVSSYDRSGDKNYSTVTKGAGYGDDIVVLRYSDILLMHSEVENEMSGLSDASLWGINQVRARAGVSTFTVADVQAMVTINQETPATDQDKLRELIIQERKWELIGEGHSWFDYVRTNILMREMTKFYEWGDFDPALDYYKKYHLLPIFITDLELNPNLKQNWGW